MNVMEKLIESIDKLNTPVVAGIDTTINMVPKSIIKEQSKINEDPIKAVTTAILVYNKIIIDNIYDLIPAVKVQIAMYEKYGVEGINIYNETCAYAKSKGLTVMGDIKRGDIGSTADAYASHLTGVDLDGNINVDIDADSNQNIKSENIQIWNEDMITINPYLGADSLTPFVNACRTSDKSCFVLVKTSNPGSSDIQDLITKEHDKPIYEVVAKIVSDLGHDCINKYGYSFVGAVVGATHRNIGTKLRQIMPHTFFLVPGYGAQGATASDLKGFFDNDGRGSIINSSRGIIANWQKDSKYGEHNIGEAARDAILNMKDDLTSVLGE